MVARTLVDVQVHDCFLGLIPQRDASAITLYNSVVRFLSGNYIPYKENLIGFGSDGTNAMLKAHTFLSSLLKNDIEGLFVMKYICHSFALCASNAF